MNKYNYLIFLLILCLTSSNSEAQISIHPQVGYDITRLESFWYGRLKGGFIHNSPFVGLEITHPLSKQLTLGINSSFTRKKNIEMFTQGNESNYQIIKFDYYKNAIMVYWTPSKHWTFGTGLNTNVISNINIDVLLLSFTIPGNQLNVRNEWESRRMEYGQNLSIAYNLKNIFMRVTYYHSFILTKGLENYFLSVNGLDVIQLSLGYSINFKKKNNE